MRAGRQIVQVTSCLVAREVALGERKVGGDVAVETTQLLDLGSFEVARVSAGPPYQALERFPTAAVGRDEVVDGGQ